MKNLLALLLLFLLAGCCAGCAPSENETGETTMPSNRSVPSSIFNQEEWLKQDQSKAAAAYAKLDNSAVLEDTFTKEYDLAALGKWYNYHLPMGFSSQSGTIQELAETLPVDNLRQLDERHYYTVYKITGGGRFYIFFEGDRERLRIRISMCAGKRLQKSDFDGIQKGSPLDAVIAVDPLAEAMKDEELRNRGKGYTTHLLTDGAIVIWYQWAEDNESLAVYSIDYFPDFQVMFEELSSEKFQCKILPQDYPA
jgi:hypothetical protein